tara:strand:- start:56 stop:652 length:597 start_codon:yes stop_codon:yes gene_type:complete
VDLNYKTTPIFPIPIHIFDVNGFNEIQDELIDYAYELRKKDPKGVSISNRGGWQSSGFEVKDENDKLHNFLFNCINGFPHINYKVNFLIYAWININKPGNYNVKHLHPTNDLSGVLWIKAPQNSGDIVFESPYEFQAYQEIDSYVDEFRNSFNIDHSYYFTPTDGRMLIFPSHLMHEVEENLSNEDRISVSFNIKLSK